jgi:hypothetical protein
MGCSRGNKITKTKIPKEYKFQIPKGENSKKANPKFQNS